MVVLVVVVGFILCLCFRFVLVLLGVFLAFFVFIQRVEHAVERGFGVAQLVAAETNELSGAFDTGRKVVHVHRIGF